MKSIRTYGRRLTVLALALCLLMLSVPAFAVSAASGNTDTLLALFSYSGGTASTDVATGDKTTGYPASLGEATVFASVNGSDGRKLEWTADLYVNGADAAVQPAMTGGSKNPWGSGAYIEVKLSTVGYTDITFSAKLGATKKGPRDYQLQYSTDGVNYVDVTGATYAITTNKTMLQAFDAVALPAAAAGQATLYIRMAVASDTLVNGSTGLAGSTGGETAVNDIVITGVGAAKFHAQGDADMDGKLSTTDARLMLQSAVGNTTFTDAQAAFADYDENGSVTTSDIRSLMHVLTGASSPVYSVTANGGITGGETGGDDPEPPVTAGGTSPILRPPSPLTAAAQR